MVLPALDIIAASKPRLAASALLAASFILNIIIECMLVLVVVTL